MPNISITVKNKVARADRAIIVCDNSDYTAVFDFDAEWDAYTTKTARFVYGGKYTDVVFTGNECSIPVIQDPRSLSVGVYAGDLHTTTPAYISCVPSILFGNGIPADPTPEVYAQIMELLGKISDESVAKAVTDALEQAKVSGEFDGEKGNDGVSPAVSVAAITGGNRVTITDAEGTKTFDVMDGAQGASGADGKDYVLTDTDKREIAKTAAGLVDVPSVQPDWNQNDDTAADYVKNRPFYTYDTETVLVEESTVSFALSGDLYVAQIQSNFVATIGETYKVSWDGAAYECTCVSFNDMPAIGNLSITGAGSDTGEPFIVGILNGRKIQIVTADTSASHTFSISGFTQEVVKIDKKYLPEPELETDPYILITESYSGTYSCNMTYDKIAELYAKYSDAIGLFDMRYNVFYLTGNENKGKQSRCISVRHSDNFYFAFGFTGGHHYFEILIHKDGTIEQNNNSRLRYMDQYRFTDGYYPLIVKSSTAGSTKKFKITVDDSGAITATEVS